MNNVFVLGDIHGAYQPVQNFYNYLNSLDTPLDNVTLILLGDVGANFFFDERDTAFKKKLGEYNLTYFLIRGNHEERPSVCYRKEPEKWNLETYFGGSVYVENDFPYIKYAADTPFQYNINGHSCLTLPGAYSVDKEYRIQNNLGWFKDEQLTSAEMQIGEMLVKSDPQWDIVLSHTCPICYEPTDLFLSSVNQKVVDKTMERYLGELEYNLDYKLWCWGHYHQTRVYPKFDDSDRIMLSNDIVLDLNKYFDTLDSYNSLIKIIHKEK